ncbi:hypothetical protein K3555_07120 [Leisingera sp. M527]|uniref:hypothetical protein n=1 Tax=Leisingera sp. M527 TaxID=2867014 RepID=UPI0021A83B32|nr:hypothetical protein [Leisingera sp. M527]UWQ34259.1 hypothetical protein K3555_07120 [Leisingera sp. M527]
MKKTGEPSTMCNPANETGIQTCVNAGINLQTLWDVHLDMARETAPGRFAGAAMNWRQFTTKNEIMRHAITCMETAPKCISPTAPKA